jgi:NADPH2:quinone reductase
MQAIRVHTTGGPQVLQLEEIAMPQPGPGEVRIRLAAIGVNFIDIYQRLGQYKMTLPFTPGMEGSGVIDALGTGVSDLREGQRVAWCMHGGAYAEYAVVPAVKVTPLRADISDEQGAALMIQGLTAHYLATSTFPLHEGHSALIHAAAGGTGRLLVQVAKRRGARVIATVGTREKAVLARSAGADDVVLYEENDFEATVKELTQGQGVDVVYDSVGQSTFDKGLNCLRPRGMMVLWGQASGPVPPFDLQVLNAKGSLYVTRPSLGAYMRTRAEFLARCDDVFGWTLRGELDVRIDQVFPMRNAAAAQTYMANRQSKGKLLLKP